MPKSNELKQSRSVVMLKQQRRRRRRIYLVIFNPSNRTNRTWGVGVRLVHLPSFCKQRKGPKKLDIFHDFCHFSVHFFTLLISFAIKSYIHETDFTLDPSQKYHFEVLLKLASGCWDRWLPTSGIFNHIHSHLNYIAQQIRKVDLSADIELSTKSVHVVCKFSTY